MDHPIRHLVYAFFLKRKQIVYKNTVYELHDAALVNCPPICPLQQATHANSLPFVFYEMDIAVMRNLNIEKPVQPLLGVVNINDAGSSRFEQVTLISTTIQVSSLMFGSLSLKNVASNPSHKRTMTTTCG